MTRNRATLDGAATAAGVFLRVVEPLMKGKEHRSDAYDCRN